MRTRKIVPRKRGADINKCTASEQKFVMELLAAGDWNLTAAVRKAYPRVKHPSTYANTLIKRPRVRALLGKIMKDDIDRLGLKREEVLLQVWYCLTRSASDFIDEDGSLREIHAMGQRAQACIDGLDIEEFIDDETGEVAKRKIKLKLVPKAQAIDMAMKHLGLNAPEEHRHIVGTVQEALERLSAPPPKDDVEAMLQAEEQRLLEESP